MRGKAAVKGVFCALVLGAVALAVGYTLTPYGWLEDRFSYFSPGVDFTGGDKEGGSPRIVVVHVSNEIVGINGNEVFYPPSDADGREIIFEDLKSKILPIEKEAGKPSDVTPGPDPENDPVIIHCNDDVRFSLLLRVICTFWAAGYENVFVATPLADENRVQVLPVFRPREVEWYIDYWFPDYINTPLYEDSCVSLSNKGFYVGAGGTHSLLVPFKEGRYDFVVMKTLLSIIAYGDEHVSIVAEPEIVCRDVIEAMVVCSELGLNKPALMEHSMDLDELLRDRTFFQRAYYVPTGGLQ